MATLRQRIQDLKARILSNSISPAFLGSILEALLDVAESAPSGSSSEVPDKTLADLRTAVDSLSAAKAVSSLYRTRVPEGSEDAEPGIRIDYFRHTGAGEDVPVEGPLIPYASDAAAGLMSPAQVSTLSNMTDIVQGMWSRPFLSSPLRTVTSPSSVSVPFAWTTLGGIDKEMNLSFSISAATTEAAGVMSAAQASDLEDLKSTVRSIAGLDLSGLSEFSGRLSSVENTLSSSVVPVVGNLAGASLVTGVAQTSGITDDGSYCLVLTRTNPGGAYAQTDRAVIPPASSTSAGLLPEGYFRPLSFLKENYDDIFEMLEYYTNEVQPRRQTRALLPPVINLEERMGLVAPIADFSDALQLAVGTFDSERFFPGVMLTYPSTNSNWVVFQLGGSKASPRPYDDPASWAQIF